MLSLFGADSQPKCLLDNWQLLLSNALSNMIILGNDTPPLAISADANIFREGC